MELRKFIRISLCEIIWGINDAYEDFADCDNPIQFMKKKPSFPEKDEYHDINFNVAVTVDEQSEPPNSTLVVMGLTLIGTVSYEKLEKIVSRIEFVVPISFTPPIKKKYLDMKNWLNFVH
ncbi:MAG: hypothetical protein ABSA17_05780 [Rhabdochlamydiaceae bacterium]